MRMFVQAIAVLLVGAYCAAAPSSPSVDSAWQLPKLPHGNYPVDREWYPTLARQEGMEGTVLVGFDISDKGLPQNVSVIWSENPVFESSAVSFLEAAQFTLPSNWSRSDALRRWRLGFVYCLDPSGQSDQFAIPVEKIYIIGSRLPKAPVRTVPRPNSHGSCVTTP
ncbi:MAG TPA: TonB family protein [Steroidobacteraceae bacterium]|nr:TonB family protein [Steroidobacteraceae bacterium]